MRENKLFKLPLYTHDLGLTGEVRFFGRGFCASGQGTRFVHKNMEYTDKAAYNTLVNTLPEFTSSNISPGTLAERLFARKIVGRDAYESALQQREASQCRRELLTNVMGCGRKGAFQDLVYILLKMEAFKWFGEKLIGTYVYTYPSYVGVPLHNAYYTVARFTMSEDQLSPGLVVLGQDILRQDEVPPPPPTPFNALDNGCRW